MYKKEQKYIQCQNNFQTGSFKVFSCRLKLFTPKLRLKIYFPNPGPFVVVAAPVVPPAPAAALAHGFEKQRLKKGRSLQEYFAP